MGIIFNKWGGVGMGATHPRTCPVVIPTSKAFAFLLSCTLGQRLRGDALDDCVAHI